jgi:predicted ester cyclase
VNDHDTQVADSDAGTPDARAVSSCPAEEVVADIFDAFGRHHVQAVTGLLCDDVIEDLPGVGAVEGINNEREFLIGLFAAFPDLRVEVTRLIAVGISWPSRGSAGDPSPVSRFKDCLRAARRSYRAPLLYRSA